MICVLKLKYVINLSIQAITIAIIKHGSLFIHFMGGNTPQIATTFKS